MNYDVNVENWMEGDGSWMKFIFSVKLMIVEVEPKEIYLFLFLALKKMINKLRLRISCFWQLIQYNMWGF